MSSWNFLIKLYLLLFSDNWEVPFDCTLVLWTVLQLQRLDDLFSSYRRKIGAEKVPGHRGLDERIFTGALTKGIFMPEIPLVIILYLRNEIPVKRTQKEKHILHLCRDIFLGSYDMKGNHIVSG